MRRYADYNPLFPEWFGDVLNSIMRILARHGRPVQSIVRGRCANGMRTFFRLRLEDGQEQAIFTYAEEPPTLKMWDYRVDLYRAPDTPPKYTWTITREERVAFQLAGGAHTASKIAQEAADKFPRLQPSWVVP